MVDASTYHDRTKHTPERLRESDFTLDPRTKPRPYKLYEDLPREPLPRIRPPQAPALSVVATSRADPLAGTDHSPGGIDRETLATLCYEASGVVQRVTAENGRELLFRAASCTGKLYHVDLYAVCGDLDDLDAGVYHFDPDGFGLDVLREGDHRAVLADAAGESPLDDSGAGDVSGTGISDAPVTFVATSTWWRNAWKYRERTYRHAFWDAGTVLANLLGAAHALDQRASVVTGFADDSVAELIGVDPEWEAPIALAPVGRGSPVPNGADGSAPVVEPIDPETVPPSPETVDYPLIYDAWRQSTLADGDAAAAWRVRCRDADALVAPDAVGEGAVGEADGGQRIPLEPVDHETASARPLHETIRRRGSQREFAAEGPTRRQVGTVLDRATRGVPGDRNGGDADGLAYNAPFVLATGVRGIDDGTYQYRPAADELERLGDATPGTKTRLALDQQWAGDAHVNVYMLTDVDRVVDRLGNRGYRVAQLEAGVTLGRLYLAAFAHRDLGGTGLTFYDDLVTDHFSPRADGLTPTCLFAFGRVQR